MFRVTSLMRLLTAIATIMMVVLLCWQCIDIYSDGIRIVSSDANVMNSIFRMDDVCARLKSLAIPFFMYVILIIITLILQASSTQTGKQHVSSRCQGKVDVSSACTPVKHVGALRMVVFVIAVMFIVLGVVNGGMYDVLVKAINICTECIGLG